MKRIISLLLVVFMALSLMVAAGCGKTEITQTKTGTNKNTISAEDQQFYDIPEEYKGVTITYASWGDAPSGASGQMMADFQSITDIKVEQMQVAQSQYPIKIAALIAADQAPDIVTKHNFLVNMFDMAMPVENVGIDPYDEFWDQNVIKYSSLNGKHYALRGAKNPGNCAGGCVYFNKSIFTENGVKTPAEYVEENNWNLDTFYTCLQQCRKIIPTTEASAWYIPDVINSAFGASVIEYDPDNGKFINNIKTDKFPKLLKCWQYVVKLIDERLISTTFSGDTDQFRKGKCALLVSGTYGLKEGGWFSEFIDPDDIGFTYLPKINKDDENYPSTVSDGGACICRGAKNPYSAAYYIRYSENPDHYEDLQTYKNPEMEAFANELNRIATLDGLGCDFSVASTMLDNPKILTKPLYESTAAQLTTNFKELSNVVDACVDKANGIITDAAKQDAD